MFTLASASIVIRCSTEMTDAEGEALWEEISNELELGLSAIKTNLEQKFPKIAEIEYEV